MGDVQAAYRGSSDQKVDTPQKCPKWPQDPLGMVFRWFWGRFGDITFLAYWTTIGRLYSPIDWQIHRPKVVKMGQKMRFSKTPEMCLLSIYMII